MIPHLFDAPVARRGSFARLSAAFLVLASVVAAQDNDSEGVLPVVGSASNGTQAASSTTVAVAVNEVTPTLDARLGRVELDGVANPLSVQYDASPEEATFATESVVVAMEAWDTLLGIQGAGQFMVQEGFESRLVAAPQAIAWTAVLIVDDGTDSLADILSGSAQPDAIVVLGPLPSVDLAAYRALLSRHAETLPGVRATVALLSVDAQGVMHAAAARGATDGDGLEILVH